MHQSSTIKTVGLFGPYGSGNLGDTAIQKAVIHNLRSYMPQVNIYGFSGNPVDTEKSYGIKSFPIYRPVPSIVESEDLSKTINTNRKIIKTSTRSIRLIKAVISRVGLILTELSFTLRSCKVLKGVDILIISGGGQLDDYWGGAWGHPFALFRWAVMAKLSRKTLLFLSVGAGPMLSWLSRFFVRNALLLADYKSYRDNYSRQVVEEMGVKRNNHVYPDLAFSLPVVRRERPTRSAINVTKVIGISPIAANAWTHVDDPAYKNYLNELIALVLWLLEENYKISFFPSQIKMDMPIIQDIRKYVNDHFGPRLNGQIIESQIATINDLMVHIDDIDIVIASRLHGVLLSHLMHRPVLAISYDRKVDHHMEDMGLSEYCLDLGKVNLNLLKTRFRQLEGNKEAVERQVSEKISGYVGALQQQYYWLFGSEMMASRLTKSTT